MREIKLSEAIFQTNTRCPEFSLQIDTINFYMACNGKPIETLKKKKFAWKRFLDENEVPKSKDYSTLTMMELSTPPMYILCLQQVGKSMENS